ncbi:carbohydrate ABC transporter permease [Anaerotalea alkaliphila]|uniref:Carbohydrate ABC transporter permease n=1 Tax=Anaerotalea alkaliphila TaxID=2662126 RepID=A0A7X5HV94_9FIRM|nr:carbohydrate ABC transporter permease [Anaerotalea alkaliphila]NDL67287.1 carbohydrate ABC transporter permease [Anaerotalea alkaliphila]
MLRRFIRLSLADKLTYVIFALLLGMFLVFILFPVAYVFIGSFMDPNQLNSKGISLNWADYRLDGYVRILSNSSIIRGFGMSLFYSVAFAIVTVVISMTMAYPLSRMDFVGRKQVSTLLLITMFFGGGLIPTFLLVKNLGMYNTVWALILPNAVSAWNIILARTFLRNLPVELRESAELDGASNWMYFMKIALPLSKPIMAVLALYAFVGQWNSYFDAMIYLESRALYPLQLVLRAILIQNEVPPGMISAQQAMAELKKVAEMIKYSSIVISSVPLILLYPFFQKYFEKGVMIGSVKG